jgi:hypothetical protein
MRLRKAVVTSCNAIDGSEDRTGGTCDETKYKFIADAVTKNSHWPKLPTRKFHLQASSWLASRIRAISPARHDSKATSLMQRVGFSARHPHSLFIHSLPSMR